MSPAIYLATVAIEPQRWAHLGTGPGVEAGLVGVSRWMDRIEDAGFDGLELWERHLGDASDAEAGRVLAHRLPIPIWNSYVSMDDPDPSARTEVADWVRRTGSSGVKFNVGNDSTQAQAYAERIASWIELLPEDTALLCECHAGLSIAEDPVVAAAIFDAAGPPDRVKAIVHTHEDVELIRERFDRYGERIGHVHVNFLNIEAMRVPSLSSVWAELEEKVNLLGSLGFRGSWTVEFVEGTLTGNDVAPYLLERAADDLEVLRSLLVETTGRA